VDRGCPASASHLSDGARWAPVDCTGDCAKDWTPVAAPAAPDKSATAIEVALIGVAPRADGTKQATYNGMPLYTYNGDKSRKDTKGQGKKAGGSTAYLVTPDGKKIKGKA
jgi:predicted lipoprotein with Yx(FWY)xxD motif